MISLKRPLYHPANISFLSYNNFIANGDFEKESNNHDESPVPIPFDVDELPNVSPLRDHLETLRITRRAVGKLGRNTISHNIHYERCSLYVVLL